MRASFSLVLLFLVSILQPSHADEVNESALVQALSGPSPWPDIRKQRVHELLAQAMRTENISDWLIVCRENDNDPLADHVGCENAGRTAVVLFSLVQNKTSITQRIFSPEGEATALIEKGHFDEVVVVPRQRSSIELAAAFLKGADAQRIAINSFSAEPQADGLSHSQYLALTSALGEAMSARLVSAEKLILAWLSRKLPQEVAIMEKAAQLTALWQEQAYATVVAGKTTDADIARFLKAKMYAVGFSDAWSAEQNPAVNSGKDRGHSHPTDRVIQHGDVIQTDFGIRVFDRWVTDIQRFAYVLQPNETAPPSHIQHAWESARAGSRAAFNAMRIDATGIDVDRAQRAVMEKAGSLPVFWSTGHPVGYVAHDAGPRLGGTYDKQPDPKAMMRLAEGMVFAFDGFFSWPLDGDTTKTISVEEMAVVEEQKARFLLPPQEQLILIGHSSD